jgi:hypothetical protein
MFTMSLSNVTLTILIVLAALGPAILDVARLAKCAVAPCRCKDQV